eukprot:gb/GECG01001644.1/.p1 GENE.gb/GECG01001644.1/~~gb/GECG01001644.1/.p1  ORF type:complete len:957 (+),score=153.97 gb/GECG01001644.1/:1-2871(+)
MASSSSGAHISTSSGKGDRRNRENTNGTSASCKRDQSLITQDFSDEVEAVFRQVFPKSKDELDLPDFDVYDYINRKFPDEDSLGDLDDEIVRCDHEIEQLDKSIASSVREQATNSSKAVKEVEDAKLSISELFSKISEIKTKSINSESMVQEICRDIKQLDVAKRNLTTSIETLHRLQMLVNSVHRLEENQRNKEYRETGTLIEAVNQLFTHFEHYQDVPAVKEWTQRVNMVKSKLKQQVVLDFDELMETVLSEQYAHEDDDKDVEVSQPNTNFGEIAENASLQRLHYCCQVIDALDMVDTVVNNFRRKQLRGYQQTFRTPDGETLEAIERRYSWFRRLLRDIESKFSKVFPAHWCILHQLCLKFCEYVRDDVDRMLSQFDPPDSAPAEALVRALNKTIQFEREMQKRFKPNTGKQQTSGTDGENEAEEEEFDESAPIINEEGEVVDPTSAEGIRLKYKRRKNWEQKRAEKRKKQTQQQAHQQWISSLGKTKDSENEGGGAESNPSEHLPDILGKISPAFEPCMGAYVKLEQTSLDNIVQTLKQESTESIDSSSGSDSLFYSAPQFFLQVKNCVNRCVQLNTANTLFQLYRAIKKSCQSLVQGLEGNLPEKVKPNSTIATRLGEIPQLPGDTYAITDDDAGVRTLCNGCLVINTAQYCGDTLPQLEELIKGKIDSVFREHVTLEEVQEEFFSLAAGAVKTLGAATASALDVHMQTMWKKQWWSITDVGDQSDYVEDMSSTMMRIFPAIRQTLAERYWRTFCDKFLRSFIPRFMSAIYKCKKMGPMGAQQLLLDAQGIRKLLQDAPKLRTEEEEEENVQLPGVPSVYTSYLSREMQRVDLLLKLVAAPKDRLAASISSLWPEASVQDINRLGELRGMRKAELTEVISALGLDGNGSPTSTRPTTLTGQGGNIDKRASAAFANVSSTIMGGLRGSVRGFSRRGKQDGTDSPSGSASSS